MLSLSCINGEALMSRSLPVRVRPCTEVIARTLSYTREVRSQGRTEDREVTIGIRDCGEGARQ